MTEKKTWESIDELLAEANAVHRATVSYRKKDLIIAWKEADLSDIDLTETYTEKSLEEMSSLERTRFNMKILEAEVLARIRAAGEQEDCFNKNVVDKEIWNKFPERIRMQIINEIFELNKEFEKRF